MIGATALALQSCGGCLTGKAEPRTRFLRALACWRPSASIASPAHAAPRGPVGSLPSQTAGAQLREWYLGGTSSGDMQTTNSLRLSNVTAERTPSGGLAAAFVQVCAGAGGCHLPPAAAAAWQLRAQCRSVPRPP